jgi:NAD(P)H-dependent FMN reductase
MAVKVLAFAGSLRAESYNKKLAAAAANAARKAGAEVTLIDLKDYPLPIFDEDIEKAEGLHPNGRKLKDLFLAHDALIISSPEYNSAYSAVLKNAIDWVSRPAAAEAPLGCFDGKTALLLSASPGALGGLRGLVVLRMLLGNIKVHVLPEQLAIVKAHEAFNGDGSLKDAKQAASLESMTAKLVKVVEKLKG